MDYHNNNDASCWNHLNCAFYVSISKIAFVSIESILRLYNQNTALILHRWTYKSHISSKYWSFYFIRIIVTMFIPYNPVQPNKLIQSIFVCWNNIQINRAKLFNYWKQILSASILVFLFISLVIICLTFLISLIY